MLKAGARGRSERDLPLDFDFVQGNALRLLDFPPITDAHRNLKGRSGESSPMVLRKRGSIQQACRAAVSRCDIQVQGDGVLKVPAHGGHRDGCVAGRCA